MNCPKCDGYFGVGYKFCPAHQKEYNNWLNAQYSPMSCECGNDEWQDGELQMTNPPTYPMMKIFRCSKCGNPKLERTEQGTVRFVARSPVPPS